MPSVVVLTNSDASPSRSFNASHGATCTRSPNRARNASARCSVRLTTVMRGDIARQQPVDHCARRAAGAEHDRMVEVAVPTRRAGVEIVQKAFDVGVGRVQEAAVVDPQRVGGADRVGAIVRHGKVQRRLLVRHGDVGADIAARGKRLHEASEMLRLDRLAAIFAGDAVGFEPVIMNDAASANGRPASR